MLCKTCQNIFQGSCPHEWSNHHLFVFQLERAASELCHICQVIWRGLNDRPLTIAGEAFEALLKPGTFTAKPFSKYQVRHEEPTENNYEITELTFNVYPNGVHPDGLFIKFYMEPMRRMTMPLRSISWY